MKRTQALLLIDFINAFDFEGARALKYMADNLHAATGPSRGVRFSTSGKARTSRR